MPERETVKPGTVYKVDFAPLYTQNKQNFSRALTAAINQGKLLAAVNQTLTSFEHPVASGDEVAFFPPVTGG